MKFYDITRENFKYNKVVNVPITTNNPNWTPVNSVTFPNATAGLFMFTLSFTWKFASTTKSGLFRFSIDGGVSWTEVWQEVKDKTNDNITYYAFPIELQAGTIDFRLEATRESGTNAMDIKYCDLMIERKG